MEKKKISWQSLKQASQIFSYLKPYKGLYSVGLITLLFSTLTTLTFPVIVGEITKVLEGKSDYGLNEVALVFAVVLVLQGIFSYFRIVLFTVVSEKATADLRKVVYEKIISSPFAFFENNRVGDLLSRLSSDIAAIQSVLTTTLAEVFRQIATLTIGLSYLFYVSWKLTLFMLATFPVTIIAAMLFGKFVKKLSKEVQTKLAEVSVVTEESLQSISTVKAYTNEKLEYKRYSGLVNEVVKMSIHLAKYRALFVSFFIVGLFGGICLVVWFGGNLVLNNEILLSDLISFLFQSIFIAGSLGGLGELYTTIQKTLGASERILEIIDEPSEINLFENQEVKKVRGEIQFKDVNFAYPSRPEVQVLKNINIHIEAGKKIALVGHSGAGKSTIVQLLMKFYALENGSITVDGQDLDVSQIRGNVAIVPQEVMLFGGSILENIAYGKPGASFEEVKAAAAKANALEFIERFPEGFDTWVGERGVKLSGGQKQRIAIARAILKDPAILVLDEATSALDSESEALIQEALETLMENRTSIIIAHRLATIQNVDTILVMKEGEVVESGSHHSLLEIENGMYAQLVKMQMGSLASK